MSLTRQTQKVFGSNANANQLAVFGSMKTGTPVYSTSLATLQSAAYTQGWSEALLNDKAPYMEEMNAVQYGLSYQIAYMLQEGAFAYDANTTYSSTSIVKAFEDGKMYFYHSLIDNNTGHALSDTTYWEKINISDTRNIGEVVTSTIPLTDAGLHLLDGSVLSGSGSYGAFVSYIAGLYTADPTANYFTTEADWQQSVTAYGVCGKFVYDSVNNTVRLPKVTGFVEGASGVANLGDLTEAGLPNITGETRVGPGSGFYINTPESLSSGVFGSGTYYGDGPSTTGRSSWGLTFDASNSNSIYGNSSTVQPQSVKVLYYIVVATATKTQIQVDIDEIATDLNGKADVDLSNVSNTSGFRKLIETYDDGTDIYKVYEEYNPSTGDYIGQWCEQWGSIYQNSQLSIPYAVALLKEYGNTDYKIQLTPAHYGTANQFAPTVLESSITTNGFDVVSFGIQTGGNAYGLYWYTCGYLA